MEDGSLGAVDFLVDRFRGLGERIAVISPAGCCSFGELARSVDRWAGELGSQGVKPGSVVSIEGEFSPNSVALLLAHAARSAIVIPQSAAARSGREQRDELAMVEVRVRVDARDCVKFERTGRTASHDLYDELRRRGNPGLVLFTSGTSGAPKAAVQDFAALLEKFKRRRPPLSTLAFLLFDHMGGLNTILHALSNGARVVATGGDRSADTICRAIEEHRVELLPATPTFLNLLLLSGVYRDRDLSGLRVISYGTEPMPETTLERLRKAFPGVRLQQTYGLIEGGVLRSKSRSDVSLWVKVGGEGCETRVVDGVFQIRTPSMILGYLNAPSPITADGWLVTGDAVLRDGDYVRFLGRKSEQINVGGEKVYPSEVESVIQQMEEVEDVTVYGERNGIVGEIVCARVKQREAVRTAGLEQRVKRHCRERLDRFKVPVKVAVTDEQMAGDRLKKLRRPGADG